jgi:hypothetical protein
MPFICELGFHDWNRAYLSTDSCEIVEKCSRCGAVKEQAVVIHEWEWIKRNPCLSQQVCKRCGAIGQIDEKGHQWKEIYKPNSYEIQKTCERCGITGTNLSGFSTFIGQEEIKLSLMTLIAAARKKGEPLHHLLLCGQLGMGKVTLAKIIATEMGVNTKITSGKTIDGEFGLLISLTDLRAGDILIIEQIESMRKNIGMLVFAMENNLEKLPRITVVGITSKPSRVDEQLRSLMFAFNFTPYDIVDLGKIISLSAAQQGINIEVDAAILLAEQSNGCPGEALLVLDKVHEYAIAYADGQITSTIAREAFAVFVPKNNSPLLERQPISDDVKMFVWKRDGGRCIKCGSQENLEYDHIVPISKGGSNTTRNIQLLCEKCNRSKGANIV